MGLALPLHLIQASATAPTCLEVARVTPKDLGPASVGDELRTHTQLDFARVWLMRPPPTPSYLEFLKYKENTKIEDNSDALGMAASHAFYRVPCSTKTANKLPILVG